MIETTQQKSPSVVANIFLALAGSLALMGVVIFFLDIPLDATNIAASLVLAAGLAALARNRPGATWIGAGVALLLPTLLIGLLLLGHINDYHPDGFVPDEDVAIGILSMIGFVAAVVLMLAGFGLNRWRRRTTASPSAVPALAPAVAGAVSEG